MYRYAVMVAQLIFKAFGRRGCRAAVGLIAAYALVLQAFMAYSLASQAAALGDTSDSFFVFCASHDGVAAQPLDDQQDKPAVHCQLCTVAGSTAATLPGPVLLPLNLSALTHRTDFVSADACISFHRARAGLSRAPPRNV